MLKLLGRMRKRERLLVVLCVLLVLGQIWFDLTLPDYMKDLTLLIQTPGSTPGDVWRVGARMLGCAMGSMGLAVICGYFATQVAAGLGFALREELFQKITDFDKAAMDHFSVPSLVIRTTNDVTQVQMVLAIGLQVMVRAPIMAVWAVIKIVNKSWQLSLLTAAFVAVILAAMLGTMVLLLPRFKRVQRLVDDINRVARENLSGISVVHAFNAERYQLEKFQRANDQLTGTQLFNQRVFAGMMPLVNLAIYGLTLGIYWMGAALIQRVSPTDVMGRLSLLGDVVTFSTYAIYVVMSLMMVVMIFMFLPAAQVSAGRIREVLEAEGAVKSGPAGGGGETGTVEFRDVSFRYPDGGSEVLEHISFRANRGDTVAIIGATGCGKTTLVSLAARLYDATGGQVLIDGRDVREYSFDALYDKVGYVTQKAVLFSGTVKSNLTFGESAAPVTGEDAWRALRLAQAEDFVENLPEKLEGRLEQGGKNLSGGQKQRLSIARALARKPEILIFDDSFSALDYRTDAALRAGLRQELGDTTVLMVAQRIGTVRNADLILVLEHGTIAGAGTHDQLMETCQVYREIAMSQLSAEELTVKGGER